MNVPSLRQRARPPSAAELAGIPWLALLSDTDRRDAAAALQVVAAEPGDRICRTGAPSNFWFGVIDGLLKMSNVSWDGHRITYTVLRCSIRCSTPAWAMCCASPSKSWPGWWGCRASGSTRP